MLLLSVLIPSIPSRLDKAVVLYRQLLSYAGDLPIEILMLTDNKKRTVGAKRQALLDAARGEYVMYVDDDDSVASSIFTRICDTLDAYAVHPDVLAFPTLTYINGGPPAWAHHALGNPNEQYNPAGFRRQPWMMHPWRRELAITSKFPDLMNGEDWGWLEPLCGIAVSELKISDAPLYRYNYNHETTEASR